MAGTFLCIGLSFVVVAVIILSTIGYHKIYVETVWATEIEEDLPEEETEYTMDLKEYTAKRIGTNLAVTKLKQNIKKGEELDVMHAVDIIHDFYVKKDGKYKVFVENRYKKKIKIGIAICVEK